MVKAKQFMGFAKSRYDSFDDIRNYALESLNAEIKSESIISIQEQFSVENERLTLVVYYREGE